MFVILLLVLIGVMIQNVITLHIRLGNVVLLPKLFLPAAATALALGLQVRAVYPDSLIWWYAGLAAYGLMTAYLILIGVTWYVLYWKGTSTFFSSRRR